MKEICRTFWVYILFGIICLWLPGCGGSTTASTTLTPLTYIYAGAVYDYSKNPAGTALSGVSVTTVGLTPAITATTDSTGTFALTGIPANTTFSIHFSFTNYSDTYSGNISMNASLDSSSSPYSLWPTTEMQSGGLFSGNSSGNGILYAQVLSNTGSVLGGAVVTATDTSNNPYLVLYYNNTSHAFTNTATGTDSTTGLIAVINIPAGTTINATASLAGYTFNTGTYNVYANAFSEGIISGTAIPVPAALPVVIATPGS